MLFEYAYPILVEAERAAGQGDEAGAFAHLIKLSLDDFGLLLLGMPHPHFPAMSRLLPRMASADVQRNWTGSDGITLLCQSLNFVRTVSSRFELETGRRLSAARILDYGCGYGRLLRLMMYFADISQLAGCDPWEQSIGICRDDGIRCRLDVTEYLPTSMPYPQGSFDFMYAFSVFTHTSLRATRAALDALRPAISADGLLAMTIRPLEYWDMDERYADRAKQLQDEHRSAGFVFQPHNRPAVDGDVTYGDTSMTFEFLSSITPRWKVIGYDRSLDDPYQIIVYLRPH